MPRKNHIEHPEYPYHVTARTHSGHFWRIGMNEAWSLMSDYLYFIHFAFNLRIHAFVLMSNHFHLLISSPDMNLSQGMNYFMRETSKATNQLSGQKNQLYGRRFYRSLISNPFYFNHVYKYVYRNPIEEGLSKRCEDYPFSTLHGLLGRQRLTVPVEPDNLLFHECSLNASTLNWLNETPDPKYFSDLEKSLKRQELFFPISRTSRNPHDLNFLIF